ncbi:cytochrome P450 [Rhizophagus irregularis DAOM 181602=DAOM 197198]|uniref:C-22 sterol desaturase n=2 Tax=Rhizophagus irregularis TaxID=588596 RepID=A0A015KN93_RHIIW|nr:C-22 sterol desaturase [Rhizophagus irregularis DAOM 197198w]GET57196.1 cytochrome P450 [Rhizophagus irregularis DAOM 181602=DAOM 197198]
MISKLFENIDYLSLIGVALIIYVTYYYYKYFNRINPLPGPLPFPLFGNLPQLYICHGGNLKKFFESSHKKYGDLFEFNFDLRTIALNRVEHIEKLLLASSKNPYIKTISSNNTEGFHELGIMGKGLFLNQDYKSWRYNRHFFTQAILSPKFSNEAVHLANKLFNELESYWDKLYLKEGVIKENRKKMDISPWFNQFTNDMIITLLTGERSYTMAGYFNELSDDEKAERPSALVDETVKFVHAIRKHLMGLLIFQFVSPFLRHYFPYFKNKSDDFIRNMKFMNQRIDAIIKRRRQEIENTPLDKPLQNDMLTSIITANTPRDINYNKIGDKEVMRPMTDPELRGIIFDGIVAGTDSTANTISFIIYYLAHYPDVKKKMLNEIDRIFQDDKTRPITENDIHNLKYCEAIVKEVSRIFSVVNSLPRCLENPDEIGGYQWQAETIIRINIDAIHHNEEYWEEPDKFNPDRWMVEEFEPKKNSFIMFGGGLRVCPGRKLAMIKLVGLMALLFRKYEIDLVDKEAPLKTESGILTACTELLVEIKLRN